MSLNWLLDDVFSNLDRGFLIERQTRQQLVNYFNTVIEELRYKNNSTGQKECGQIMEAAIRYHRKSKNDNKDVCLFGKYHDILYVVAKLCYCWKYENSTLISQLLLDIYECEKTMEKFFECSIFGSKITQLISGWRSDYCTQEENINASLYFLQHATKTHLTFNYNNSKKNFIDLPMNCYGNMSPLKAAVKAEKWDLAILLIKFGAVTYVPFTDVDYEKYAIFQIFVEKLKKHAFDYYDDQLQILLAFKIFMRAIPSLSAVWKCDDNEEEVECMRSILFIFLNNLNLFDIDEPRSLKHLSKCATRKYLAENHLLPVNSNKLCIPSILEHYLNLEID